MKIKLVRGTVVKGKDYDKGSVIDTDLDTGKLLVGMNKAIEVKPEDKAEPQKKRKKVIQALTTENCSELVGTYRGSFISKS